MATQLLALRLRLPAQGRVDSHLLLLGCRTTNYGVATLNGIYTVHRGDASGSNILDLSHSVLVESQSS